MTARATVRPDMARSLRAALVLVAAVATGATGAVVALVWSTHEPYEWLIALYATEGLADVVIGALAWDRRPSNRTGMLLCVLGAATMVSAAGNVGDLVVSGVGSVLGEVLVASLLHIVLAFPSGRLPSGRSRALVAATYAIAFGSGTLQYVFGNGAAAFPGWGLQARPDIVSTSYHVANWLSSAVILLACAEKSRQVRAQRRSNDVRPAHLGVFVYGIGTLVFLAASALLLGPVVHISRLALFEVQMLVFAWIPVVYATGVLRAGFARTAHIEQLGAWLTTGASDLSHLRDALAAIAGDPSLELLPAAAEPNPGLHPGRGAVRLEGTDGPLATVVYDRALIGEPGTIRSASQLVAVAIERQQLADELLESRRMIRESRTRIVQVADQERRRLAQNLHDLLQNRLILAALHAGQLATGGRLDPENRHTAQQLGEELQRAITDLRLQVQGIMPALLVEQGLPAALEDLADRLPLPATVDGDRGDLRLSPTVASTGYFIVAEAFTNTLKHAAATNISVRLTRHDCRLRLVVADDGVGGARLAGGAGLRGIADRVEALDGTVHVHSPPNGGTTISVELPCGS